MVYSMTPSHRPALRLAHGFGVNHRFRVNKNTVGGPPMFTKRLLIGLLLIAAPLAQAEWKLDADASSLSFVTTKATSIAEVNHFDRLDGKIDAQGNAMLVIDLTSVNTGVPVRDERMQKILFETGSYPKAILNAKVPLAQLSKMKAGGQQNVDLDAKLNIRGVDLTINTTVSALKLQSGALLVSSIKPIVVNASAVDLADGVEALRQVAGLPNISLSVIVTFQLLYMVKN